MFAWICPKCGKEIPPQYDGCPEWCPEYTKRKAHLKQATSAPPEMTSPVLKNLMQLEGRADQGPVYTGATYSPAASLPATPGSPAMPPSASPNAPTLEAAETPRYRSDSSAFAYDTPLAKADDAGRHLPPLSEIRDVQTGRQVRVEAPKEKNELNPILVAFLAAIVFCALGYAAFKFYEKSSGSGALATVGESAANAPGQHRLNKIISVTGLRFVPGKNKQMEAVFLVVNNSGAQTPVVSGTVAVRAKADEATATPILSFPLTKVALGPYDSKELRAPLQTALKAYELPDGNLVRMDLLITEPAQ